MSKPHIGFFKHMLKGLFREPGFNGHEIAFDRVWDDCQSIYLRDNLRV
jgi:hypothetical protein